MLQSVERLLDKIKTPRRFHGVQNAIAALAEMSETSPSKSKLLAVIIHTVHEVGVPTLLLTIFTLLAKAASKDGGEKEWINEKFLQELIYNENSWIGEDTPDLSTFDDAFMRENDWQQTSPLTLKDISDNLGNDNIPFNSTRVTRLETANKIGSLATDMITAALEGDLNNEDFKILDSLFLNLRHTNRMTNILREIASEGRPANKIFGRMAHYASDEGYSEEQLLMFETLVNKYNWSSETMKVIENALDEVNAITERDMSDDDPKRPPF